MKRRLKFFMSKPILPKVFGIGWAKTGTSTLGKCLEILGYNHQSQRLDLVDDIVTGDLRQIFDIVKKKESFEDWPWILLYKELDHAFKGSKFILTVRDTSKWLKSYRNMQRNEGEVPPSLNKKRRILYGLPFPDVTDAQLMERYERHNSEVLEYFKDKPDSLLTIDWEDSADWETICHFLDKPMPNVPFPHENRGKYI